MSIIKFHIHMKVKYTFEFWYLKSKLHIKLYYISFGNKPKTLLFPTQILIMVIIFITDYESVNTIPSQDSEPTHVVININELYVIPFLT